MKLLRNSLATFLLSLFLLSSCSDSDLPTPSSELVRAFTSLNSDSQLQEIVSQQQTFRQTETALDRANWDNVYKIEDPVNDRITYSVPLYQNQSGVFEHLVFISENSYDEGIVFRYTPTSDWYANHYSPEGMMIFSGQMDVLNLSDQVIISSTYEDGLRISTHNARLSEEICSTWIDVQMTVVNTPDGSSFVTELTWTEYEVCEDVSGGNTFPPPSPLPEGPSGGPENPTVGLPLIEKCPENALMTKDGCECQFGEIDGVCISEELYNFLNSDRWNQQDPYDDWNRLTECEKDFFRTHPTFLVNAAIDKKLAEDTAKDYFEDCTLHNGIGDAFRHALFSALNTRRMGYIGAKTLGDCHETERPADEQDQVDMDLHNNDWGYSYAFTHGVVHIGLFYEAFMEAYNNGEIVILKEC